VNYEWDNLEYQGNVGRAEDTDMWKGLENNMVSRREGDRHANGIKERKEVRGQGIKVQKR
jgi:hypothetical protein